MKLQSVYLEGRKIILEPLDRERHVRGLADAIRDGELWTIPVTIVPHPDNLPAFFSMAQSAFEAGQELAFATIDKVSGTIVGSTRFRCIEPSHKRIEIGFTFLAKTWQKTHVNTEAKYLMLKHAFETWECNRVELLTDVLNQTSRNAIARLGAKEEGVLRNHMVMRDGRIRDSIAFSIIRSEWPSVKEELERKLMN